MEMLIVVGVISATALVCAGLYMHISDSRHWENGKHFW